MFTIAAPTKQTAEDTIITLSSRLSSATLLEDRRAAILGLKSFSSSYPATVSSNALRGLIACLDRDRQDVDTTLAILQTLLQLFNPNENSPEASEEIALWVADEFTQQQKNITLLLDFLDAPEFYSKLCCLKLLTAILSSRSERTKELICAAPLGISRLVAVLDDTRDALRNEGMSLLIYLTPNSTELQKRVVFEDAFDRIYNIINTEGSLIHGDRIVEDCLILQANLLRLNESNQTFFRETGFVPKAAQLLANVTNEKDSDPYVTDWAIAQKDRNIFALLAVLRLFLVTGGAGTPVNQKSFWQHGILTQALKLAFINSTETQVKSEALVTCADIIRGEPSLQEKFAQLQVTLHNELPKNSTRDQDETPHVYVIDGLLEIVLNLATLKEFDTRIAACECIKAYFNDHSVIRQHFLRRAIDGHLNGIDTTPNFLTILLSPLDSQGTSDPYRLWFAAVIFFHLVFNNPDTKTIAMSVSEGDTTNGEEEITCLQKLTGNLLACIRMNADERILVGYFMLICGWMFEDPDSVNDFLGEGSHLQSLIQTVLDLAAESSIVQGLCAMLLGILYEYSTKDSPISRSTIHQILSSQFGRDKYIDRLSMLRSHPLLRDFEVLPQNLSSATTGGFPEVFFDKLFVEFTKDNFSRILRAFDRDPGYEVPLVLNGVQRGISREMVDSLRDQLDERNQMLQKCQDNLKIAEETRSQEQADSQKSIKYFEGELSKAKQVNESLQSHHNEIVHKIQLEHNIVIKDYKNQLEHVNNSRKIMEVEISNLKHSISQLELNLLQSNNNALDYQKACDKYKLENENNLISIRTLEKMVESLEAGKVAAAKDSLLLKSSLSERESEKRALQVELEDLLMVFTDLEEKVTRYKNKLRILGETVSDVEDNGDNSDDNTS